MSALLALSQLQQLLQSIHGVQAAPVRDFLVDRAFRERHAPRASPHEALLLRDGGEELHVALFLDESVLAQLARPSASPWTQERLQGFCAAAEGVSHFLYLAHRARQGGQVSQLELEAQGRSTSTWLCSCNFGPPDDAMRHGCCGGGSSTRASYGRA